MEMYKDNPCFQLSLSIPSPHDSVKGESSFQAAMLYFL